MTVCFRTLFLLAVVIYLAPLYGARKTPIYVGFSHHIDDGRRDATSTAPTASSAAVRWLMQTYEKRGIKAQLEFLGNDLDENYRLYLTWNTNIGRRESWKKKLRKRPPLSL